MHADKFHVSEHHTRSALGTSAQAARYDNPDHDVMLKIVMASMPLAGLIFGVVALAIWHAA